MIPAAALLVLAAVGGPDPEPITLRLEPLSREELLEATPDRPLRIRLEPPYPAAWSWRNTVLALALAGVQAVDIGQSRWAQRHWGAGETNPLMPLMPSMAEYIAGAAIAGSALTLAAVYIDPPFREAFQAMCIGGELANVLFNGGSWMTIGFRMEFK